jgi:pilus assembly protein CpaC
VSRRELSRPDDGFADSTDPSAMLLARFNRLYGVTNATSVAPPVPVDSQRAYRGNYGFILD